MRYRIVFFLPLFLLLVSCATTPDKIISVSVHSETVDSIADGISIVHISVKPNTDKVAESILKFGEPIGSSELQASMHREGLQLLKIQAVDVPAIVATIGTVNNETYAWHSQILKWRDLHQRVIDRDGMLISENGVLYFIQRGILSYFCRAWLLQNEDGYCIYFEGVPTWHVPRNNQSMFTTTESNVQNQVFTNLQVETLLKDGEAVLLASHLRVPVEVDGPQDVGGVPVRLGEALLGGPVQEDVVQLLIIEANVIPRM